MVKYISIFILGIVVMGASTLSFQTSPLLPATESAYGSSSFQKSGVKSPIQADKNLPSQLPLDQTEKDKYNHFGLEENRSAGVDFESLGITLHPGSAFTADDHPTPGSLNHCKNLVYRTLRNLPTEVSSHIKNLTLYFSEEGRRGLAGGNTMILRCLNVSDKEFVAVATHESGHIIDTGLLQGSFLAGASEFSDGGNPVYNDDPSLIFYRLSFKDEKSIRENSSAEDFVSGYATSDPFEDFAETTAFYLLHGKRFRLLKATNEVLAKKYAFMKTWVFHGKEYDNGDLNQSVDLSQRDYDTTVLDYDINKFFVL